MKNLYVLLLSIACLYGRAYAYESAGTTVKKDKCDVIITIQIALETDRAADIAMIQNALDECFSIVCDLPCEDRKVGYCHVKCKVLVVNLSTLSIADTSKFHRVKMKAGRGVSLSWLGKPNERSATGEWYRDSYSPKVFCHEVLHLCGLEDRYRDCRRNRIDAGVDNCKDGKRCTQSQIDSGLCPPCDGYADDCMATDVRKPMSCNNNIMEIVRLAHDARFVCSEECCKPEFDTTKTGYEPEIPKKHIRIGGNIDGGVGWYHIQDKENKDDKLNLWGYHLGIGARVGYGICEKFEIDGRIRLDVTGVQETKKEEQTIGPNTYTYVDHYKYNFLMMAIAFNAIYTPCQLARIYAGPQFGFIASARGASWGTTTVNNMTTEFGNKELEKLTADKKVQVGLNIGAMHDFEQKRLLLSPYFNIYIPFTGMMDFTGKNNRLYRFSAGLAVGLH